MSFRFESSAFSSYHTFPFGSVDAGANSNYTGGFYAFSATPRDFTLAPSFGTANAAYGAHFLVVLGANTVNDLTLRVTGTSFTDAGVRTAGDTEDIVLTHPALVNDYFETSKKWIGAVVITVVSGTAKICGYGWSKYWDRSNTNFTLKSVEVLCMGDASDSGANFTVLHHKTTGWTYNAGAAPSPPAAIYTSAGDYVTEREVFNNEVATWKRTGLSTAVNGAGSEGLIFNAIQTSASPFGYGYFKIEVQPS